MCPDRLYHYRPTSVEGNTLLHRRGRTAGEVTTAEASQGTVLSNHVAKVFLFGKEVPRSCLATSGGS